MSKKILVVDDESSILNLLLFKLSNQGYNVITARDDKEFWEKALLFKPDLVILDIWLKNKVSTEVYHNLLHLGFDRNVPVIFITALVENTKPKQYSTGTRYALHGKPLDFDLLLSDIKRMLEPNEDAAAVGAS